MKSLIIGIGRPGDADNVLLSPDTRYLSRCGTYPEVTFSIECKQKEFYDNIVGLRYIDADPGSSSGAISFFEKLMSDVFTRLKYLVIDNTDKTPFHIRLVITPIELAQLPFEFVPSSWDSAKVANTPLLVNPNRTITLTREVLQESEPGYTWPKQPRILFAWAEPGDTVPHEEHKNALISSLKPLARPKKNKAEPEPDTELFLSELPNASLKSIKKEILQAIRDGRPYSHIHILAHGGHAQDFTGVEFRLILNDDADPKEIVKAQGKDVVDAIIPDKNNIPIIVTLSSCDSANMGNVMRPSGSLVYQLHQAGIPCVFASQFPLTQEGSITLVKSLYSDFIKGSDPREALYNARLELKKNNTHDWASLVAYARFPNDINEQSQAIWLKILFASMKTTGEWVDHVLKHKDEIKSERKEEIFSSIEDRLGKSIAELSKLLVDGSTNESNLKTDALRSEHLGLLGSAYKRKAEFLYRLIEFNPEKKKDYLAWSDTALRMAKDCYYGGYDTDLGNHWTAMQCLSLKVVLGESSETDKDMWQFIYYMTKKKEEKEIKAEQEEKAREILAGKNEKEIPPNINKIWVWGTLTELYLIKPLTVPANLFEDEKKTSLEEAKRYGQLIREAKNEDVIDSTKRQLDRYISWWPEIYAKTYRKELKEMASEILDELLKNDDVG